MRTLLLPLLLLLIAGSLAAQTLGGSTVFNFLKVPASPRLTALGGINVSHTANDISLAFNNPALLRSSMHTQLSTSFNDFYAGITGYHLALGYHSEQLNTNFLWGLNYFNYGSIQQTDASGNLYGQFRPTDFVMQVAASKTYLEKWSYGATLKFISSNYGQYRSNGIAVDVGVQYWDTTHLFSASVLAKNMGTQLRKYDGTDPGDLPFDLQVGLSKRLQNSFLGFSVTAHHLNQFDILYNDTTFNNSNDYPNAGSRKLTFDKLFRHVVIAADIYLGDKVEVSAGYNHLRRKELNIGSAGGNGLNGFSMGVTLLLNKLQVNYSRAQYQSNTAYNQFGLNLKLNEYFGLGKFGQRIGW